MPWATLVPVGIILTFRVIRRTSPGPRSSSRCIGAFWWLLFIYFYLWIYLLWPFIKVQGPEESLKFYNHMNAIGATIPMFAFVAMGLLMDSFLVWLGLAVTGLIVVGLFLFPTYFLLWMAFVGGGSLAGTGLFIRNRWK